MRAALIVFVALAALTWVQPSVGAAPRFVRNIDTGETGWFSSPALVDLDRRPPARDRRAVLQHVRLRRARAGCWARARRPRGGSTRPAWSPTSTATARRRSSSAATTGTVAAYNLGGGGLQLKPAGRPRPAAAASARRRAAWRPPTSTATAASRSWRRRRTPRATARRCSSSTASGAQRARLAAVQRVRRRLQRHRQPRLRRLRRERRRSASSTTTRSSRSSSPSTTTRSTSSTTTGRRCSRRRGTRTARATTPAARLGWGQFIRWLSPKVEDDHYHRHVGDWPQPSARRRGCSGRPRRRRSPTSTATAATR